MVLITFSLPLSATRSCFSASDFLHAFCFHPLQNYSQQTGWLFSIRNCILMKCLAFKNGIEMMMVMGKYRSTKETKAQTESVRGMKAASWIKTGTNGNIFRNKRKKWMREYKKWSRYILDRQVRVECKRYKKMTDERTIRQGQEINHKEKKGKDEKFMLQWII